MNLVYDDTPRQRRALQKSLDLYNAAQAAVIGFVPLTVEQYWARIAASILDNYVSQHLRLGGGEIVLALTAAERTAIRTRADTDVEIAALWKQIRQSELDMTDATTVARVALLVSTGAMTQARVDAVFS